MKNILLSSCMGLLLAMSSPATTLFDNGTFDGVNGNGIGDALQAQDFILGSASNVTGFRFYTLEASGAYLGSISWQIWTSLASRPATLIANGNTAAVTRTNVGASSGLNIVENLITVNVANLANLAAGTYWLTLHNGLNSDTDFQDIYWATTELNAVNTPTTRGLEFNLPGGTEWNTNEAEHAFQILGDAANPIPEPGTFVLLTAGLAMVVGARRFTRG